MKLYAFRFMALRAPALGAIMLAIFASGCGPKTTPEASTAPAAAPAPTTTPATETASTEPAPVIEPAAMTALEQMGAYLRTLTTFEVVSDTLSDLVMDDGQKVQIGGKITYRVRRPNAFMIVHDTDRKKRSFYYDGKTFTVFAPRMNFYAQVEAPPTIKETLAKASDKYDIEFPLADLFYWGTEDAETDDIVSGFDVGYAKVGDADCEQYAFREGDVDWQIFIQNGDRPLPRKIVITSRSDEARPQFIAVLNWNEKPSFTDATFAFKPPADAHPIRLASN